MTIYRITRLALLPIMLCLISACGGGGGGGGGGGNSTSTPKATLKLFTSGTPSANLSGNDITVILADGVTPTLNGNGSVADSVIVVSGVAAPGMVLAPIYTAATATSKGTLRFTMASTINAGFGAGEFATMTLNISAGKSPVQGDFSLSGFNPIDVSGNTANGLTAGFTVAIQ
ncbi:MAG: hypothetical protein WA140_10370 [Geobacteraceae bacterium]